VPDFDPDQNMTALGYVSIKYTERLSEAGIEPSVGSVGDSYDNALASQERPPTIPLCDLQTGIARLRSQLKRYVQPSKNAQYCNSPIKSPGT
jgi:transposase InsO family protein